MIKTRQPAVFSGEGSDLEGWIISFQSFLNINSVKEEDIMKVLGSYLGSKALVLYEVTINHNPNISWSDFRNELRQTFDSYSYLDNPMVALANRSFHSDRESLADYYIDKLRLMERLGIKLSEKERLTHLVSGLDQQSRTLLALRSDLTIATFLSVARMVVMYSSDQYGVSTVVDTTKPDRTKSQVQSMAGRYVETPVVGTDIASIVPECIFCGRKNHKTLDCFYNPRNAQRGYNYRGNNYRGNKNYRGRGYYGNPGDSFSQYGYTDYNLGVGNVNDGNVPDGGFQNYSEYDSTSMFFPQNNFYPTQQNMTQDQQQQQYANAMQSYNFQPNFSHNNSGVNPIGNQQPANGVITQSVPQASASASNPRMLSSTSNVNSYGFQNRGNYHNGRNNGGNRGNSYSRGGGASGHLN